MGLNVTTPSATAEHEVTVGAAPQGNPVEHFTPAERAARGKGARAEVPRSAHGAWEPSSSAATRWSCSRSRPRTRLPELGADPLRANARVAVHILSRRRAYLMAADLADGTRTGLHAQLCGDAHLSNFGVFAAPDRRLVFSINDFDETLPGPFEWDVKRLAASFAVAARDRGFDEATRRSAVLATVREYREAMAQIRGDAEHRRLVHAPGRRRIVQRFADEMTAKASDRDRGRLAKARDEGQRPGARQALSSWSTASSRIVGSPPLITPIEDVLPGAEQAHLEAVIRRMIGTYRSTLPRDRRQAARAVPVRPCCPQGRRRR